MKEKITWSRWIEKLGTELYTSPTAYKELLPELADLTQYRKEQRSSYKLNGQRARNGRKDKTIISEALPLVVLEHGDRAYSIISLVMNNRHCSYRVALEQIAGCVGMELPEDDMDQEAWIKRQTEKELMATAQEYYQWCLHNADGAEPQRQYLLTRWPMDKVERMELGYIPSQEQLKAYLLGKSFGEAEVKRYLEHLNSHIGTTHKITTPIYQAGTITSWIYRHHNQADAAMLAKYQYQSRLDGEPQQNTKFYYIPGSLRSNPNLVIVEGQIDARSLAADGIPNVVATGTNAVNADQVRDAVKRGCRSITLMYDADPTDKDQNVNHASYSRAINVILGTLREMGKADEVRIYVAVLPQTDPTQKVDPDSFINEHGAAAAAKLIAEALPYWEYELQEITKPYTKDVLTPKQVDAYIDEAAAVYCTIADPMHQRQFIDELAGYWDGTAIDTATIEKKLAESKRKQDKERATAEAAELMRQAGEMMRQGKTYEALKLQGEATRRVTAMGLDEEYTKTRQSVTKAQVSTDLKNQQDGLHTGLHLGTPKDNETEEERGNREIILPAGAISVVAAPTSHGKTTMLVSTAVNAAKANPDKEYYLFSYEENLAAIVVKALSCYAGLELSVNNKRTITTYLTTGEWISNANYLQFKEREQEFFAMLEQGRLHINYTSADSETLCGIITRLAEERNLGGVFIDYVQEIDLASTQGTYSRQEQLGKVCRQLLDVAVDTGTPIVLGAQFNREVSDPSTLAASNIREAGDIEHKAAYILGFWNNDMPYQNGKRNKVDMAEIGKLTKGAVYDAEQPNKNQSIYAAVLKNRGGYGAKAGTAGLLGFNGNIGTITDIEERPLQTLYKVNFND